MSKPTETSRDSRRRFLKGVVVAGGAVGTGLAAGGVVAVTPEETEGQAPEERVSGYQESAHIRTYYDSTRS